MSTIGSAVLGQPASSTRDPLDRLLNPRSIAVIGASTDPAKRGYQAVRALRESGYRDPVYPVNPRGGVLFGLPVRTGIGELPHGVDVALVALPAPAVPSVLRELGAAGVAAAVVLANGFRESGTRGAELEAQLAAAVTETGIRVVGPNTSGILNVATGANLVGVPDVPAGPVSVITQSGNMLLSLLADDRAVRGPGFHSYVGLGNQVDLRYDECLTHLAAQPGTASVAMHTEGLTDGRAFLVAAAATSRDTPVVLLRGGRSAAGQRAALSHTGSVAGSDQVARAVLAQAGVELVDRGDELAVLAGVLATTAPPRPGTGVAVLSDGGGHATLAVDALAGAGVPLAELTDATLGRLRRLLGESASVRNPVDVAGATDADPTLFAEAADALMADPEVGLVLMVGLYGGYHLRFDERLDQAEHRTSAALGRLPERHGVPLLVQSCYAGDHPGNHEVLRTHGVPVLASLDHAVRAVAALHRRGHHLATADARSSLRLPDRARPSADRAVLLDEPSARRLVQAGGLRLGPWRLARDAEQLRAAVLELGPPAGGRCAVKVVSPQVTHKSDVGGVALDVTVEDAERCWSAIMDSVTTRVPDAEITGVVVTPMAGRGVELLVGATVDPIFGPVVSFGMGGVLVEALGDVTFRAAPLTHLEALEMIAQTRASRLLDGYRQLPPVDRDALARLLVRVGELAVRTPGFAELDLNPVIANADGIRPVDVRLVITDHSAR